jgi:transaldolase
MLTSGTLKKYIDTLSVTGLTSNPTIFDHTISRSNAYDSEIRRLVGRGLSGETLFFELAIQDLTQAADMFAPIHERTNGVDGWVSLEVSPLLAYDSQKSSDEAKALHAKANRRNLFIKIPGTWEGLPAIEETIASGVPVNVAAVLARAICSRRRGLTKGPRTTAFGGAEPRCAFRRLAIRQPLG